MVDSVDKLSLVASCCALTGNSVPVEEDDGSMEWNACSAGYEKGLRRILDSHNWKFAKVYEEVEERDDPVDPNWQDSYARPSGCIHVLKVMDQDGGLLEDWKIVGDQILCNHEDGIAVEFIEDVQPNQWPGLFVDAMMHFVFAGIYRGIAKEPGEARREEAKAEAVIAEARPRGDSEEPGRAKFISSGLVARRARRG